MSFADAPGVPPLAVLRAAVVLAGVLEPDWRQPAPIDVIALARDMLQAAAVELDWEEGFLARIGTTASPEGGVR